MSTDSVTQLGTTRYEKSHLGESNYRRNLRFFFFLVLKKVREIQLSPNLAQSQTIKTGVHRLIFMRQESVGATHYKDERTQQCYIDDNSANHTTTTLNLYRILQFIKFTTGFI